MFQFDIFTMSKLLTLGYLVLAYNMESIVIMYLLRENHTLRHSSVL